MTKEASMLVNWRLSENEKGVSALARINSCKGAIIAGGHSGHGTCGAEECNEYCEYKYGDDMHDQDSHGPYDAAPKMAAGWMTCALVGLLLLKFYS